MQVEKRHSGVGDFILVSATLVNMEKLVFLHIRLRMGVEDIGSLGSEAISQSDGNWSALGHAPTNLQSSTSKAKALTGERRSCGKFGRLRGRIQGGFLWSALQRASARDAIEERARDVSFDLQSKWCMLVCKSSDETESG